MRTPSRAWVVAAVLCSAAAAATTLLAADVPGLTRASDAVVRGKVAKATSRWTGDHLRIVTDVEVEVTEALKGSVPKTVIITQPGGVVGDVGQKVSGLASFEEGEEVLVFLERRPGDRYFVSGMAQGKYRIERSSDGKDVYAVPDTTGDALLLDPKTRQPVPPVGSARRPPTLDELAAQIRAATRAAPVPEPGPPGRKPAPEKTP